MQTNKIKVGASILAGDFGRLAEEAERIEASGADSIHIDVMDGHFVPNLSFGPQAVRAISQATNLPLSVHLMMYNPYDYIEIFVAAGADAISFHFEATEDIEDTLLFIKKCNVKAGLAFNPDTSFEMMPKYMDKCDFLLLMTVNPGFEGQKFLPKVLDKIRLTRDVCNRLRIGERGKTFDEGKDFPPLEIVVDGGINPETGKLCIEAGANYLVSGSYLFKQPDMNQGVNQLKSGS